MEINTLFILCVFACNDIGDHAVGKLKLEQHKRVLRLETQDVDIVRFFLAEFVFFFQSSTNLNDKVCKVHSRLQ